MNTSCDQVSANEPYGTSNAERTNYFQNDPSAARYMALWMESGRMCCMNAAVNQAKFDEQRRVVQKKAPG